MNYEDLAFMIWMENQEKKDKCIYADSCGRADCISCGDYAESELE